jgi:putative tricarboxylic transport membrane protein
MQEEADPKIGRRTITDGLALAVLLGVAIYAANQSFRFGLWSPAGPGDGLFPFACAVGIAVISIGLLAKLMFWGGVAAASVLEGAVLWRKVAVYSLALVALAATFEWLGFRLTTAVALLAIFRGGERVPWHTSLLVTALLVGSMEVLFVRLLDVQLPDGDIWLG